MPSRPIQNDDESDHESVSELLSPSDGYFTEGHTHPGQVLVPDPAQDHTKHAKEREAAAEMRPSGSRSTNIPIRVNTNARSCTNLSSSIPSRPGSPIVPTSPTQRSVVDPAEPAIESTPLLSSAPPAYSPPEPGSPYHPQSRQISSAGIYQTMGRPERFFSNAPENMGGESAPLIGGINDGDDKRRWTRRCGDWWDENSNKVFKYIMLALAFLIAVGFIVDLIVELSMLREGKHEEVKIPAGHSIPRTCKLTNDGHLQFNWERASEFEILQLPKATNEGPYWTRVQTLGQIRIRAAPESATDAVQVDLDYYWSDPAVASDLEFSKEDGLLRIYTATSVQNYKDLKDHQPCLYMDIIVWIKPNLQQSRLAVQTATLDVIFDGNHTALATETFVNTLAASVQSIPNDNGHAHWGGRQVKIITHAGSIHGTYPLYDELYLETSAGSINTNLTLHPGRDNAQSLALLTLKSSAGSIGAFTPLLASVERNSGNHTIDDIPKRDYRTKVDSRAGSVHLQLVHGSKTSISSGAGSVIADLTPWLEPYRSSDIVVDSSTGTIDITVKDAIAYPGKALRNLNGDYKFSTGHLTLRYPAEWEGRVSARSMTGRIQSDWPGLEITRRSREGIYSKLEGHKGRGDATLDITGASGGIDLLGKGGDRYPNATGDHRRGFGPDDDDRTWPIVLPPMFKKTSKEMFKQTDLEDEMD